MGFWSRQASTTTDSDQGNPSRRQARQAYSNGHTATATTYNKHPVTDALQQQLRTMMSAIQGRKAFVQCAILVAVILLALTANAAALKPPPPQEHRHGGGRHYRRHPPHHDYYDPCDCQGGCEWSYPGLKYCYVRDPRRCGWANDSQLYPGEKWRRCPWG